MTTDPFDEWYDGLRKSLQNTETYDLLSGEGIRRLIRQAWEAGRQLEHEAWCEARQRHENDRAWKETGID